MNINYDISIPKNLVQVLLAPNPAIVRDKLFCSLQPCSQQNYEMGCILELFLSRKTYYYSSRSFLALYPYTCFIANYFYALVVQTAKRMELAVQPLRSMLCGEYTRAYTCNSISVSLLPLVHRLSFFTKKITSLFNILKSVIRSWGFFVPACMEVESCL